MMLQYWWLGAWCGWLGAIDALTGRLPNKLIVPGIVIGLFWHATSCWIAFLHLAFGFLYPFLVNHAYFLVKKRPGLGMGDMKMIALISLCLGWRTTLHVILIACLFSLLYQISIIGYMIGKRLNLKTGLLTKPHPFGPWLALAVIIIIPFLPGKNCL